MSIEAISQMEPSLKISRLLSGIFVREVFQYFKKLFSDGHIVCISCMDHIIVKVGRLYLLSTVKEVFEGMVFFVNKKLYARTYKEPLLMEFFEETGGGVLFKIRSMWRDESERGRNYAKDQSISQFVEDQIQNMKSNQTHVELHIDPVTIGHQGFDLDSLPDGAIIQRKSRFL